MGDVNADGSIMQPDSERAIIGKGNGLFHVDSGELSGPPLAQIPVLILPRPSF